jgi:two-component system sensor histidine kinase PilS (NtrC family)
MSPANLSLIGHIRSVPRRELYFFGLYRVLTAGLVAALVFSPLAATLAEPRFPRLAAGVAVAYLVMAAVVLAWGRNERWLRPIVAGSVLVDIVVAVLAIHAIPGAGAGIAMMLLFNVASAAILLPLADGLAIALAASAGIVAEYVWSVLDGGPIERSPAELAMFAASYLALAWICFQIGRRARSNQVLAEQRGQEVASLAEINELIIRRMRTGVLVVDADNRITLANEAAAALLGDGEGALEGGHVLLPRVAPQLAARLVRWRASGESGEAPVQLSPDLPEVQPRFARLLGGTPLTLVFLDDATVVSRRAESLTLSTLGRFSASLAHEIRNPLAAITYAAQLLAESRHLDDADRRLLQIIDQQCQRTNGIVESVLGIARRDRANPENVDVGEFVRRFVEDYRLTLGMETDTLEAPAPGTAVQAQADPRHLHQILTALVHNAFKYGRKLDQPAVVRVRAALLDGHPVVDVVDRGPGIPPAVAEQLFRPFFTTSEHGTGLGLYIARELCRANQARLEYVAMPGGGACFRIHLPAPHALAP